MVGTSGANISRYETGKHGAGSDILGEMANVFNVNPAWLMGANVDKYLDSIIPAKKDPCSRNNRRWIPYHSRRIYN